MDLRFRHLHLTIHFDRRLSQTPYRADNPRAAELLGQECPEHWIVLDPDVQKVTKRHHLPPHLQVEDERHEVVEDVILGRLAKLGVPKKERYPLAHHIANKLQRRPGAEKIVRGKVKLTLIRRGKVVTQARLTR